MMSCIVNHASWRHEICHHKIWRQEIWHQKIWHHDIWRHEIWHHDIIWCHDIRRQEIWHHKIWRHEIWCYDIWCYEKEDNLILKIVPGPSLRNLSCTCYHLLTFVYRLFIVFGPKWFWSTNLLVQTIFGPTKISVPKIC